MEHGACEAGGEEGWAGGGWALSAGSSPSPRPDSGASRVSSVLNRNTRQFGKKHLFDQDEETCWNSDQVSSPTPYGNQTLGPRVPLELQGTTGGLSRVGQHVLNPASTLPGPLPVGDTGVSPACPCLPAADPVPGGLLQSPGLPRRYWKALEEGGKGSEGTPWPHSLPLSLLQVLRGVRLSVRLRTSTLKTTTPFRYPTLASGRGWSVPLKAAPVCGLQQVASRPAFLHL